METRDLPTPFDTRPALRGRPRDARSDAAIVEAARAILAESGFDALSFESVALRAGVTRPTIYRRWPTKAHLANEVANHDGGVVPDIVASEGLRAQIYAFVDTLYAQYARPEMRAATAGLVVSYHRMPALRDELHTPLEAEARARFAAIIAKAKTLELVRESLAADALFDVVVGAVIFRMIHSAHPPDADNFSQICDIVLEGIERR